MARRVVDPGRLESFVKNSGLSYRLTSRSYVFTCPLCRKKNLLYIARNTGQFVCFKCRETRGFRGAPEYALKELTQRPINEIRKALYGDMVVAATSFLVLRFDDLLEEGQEEPLPEEEPLPDLVWPYHCYPIDEKHSKNGRLYLEGRGIPVELAREYDIRYSPPQRSVAFPVQVGDRLVGWQYRIIDPETVVTPEGDVIKRLKIWSDSGEDEVFPRDRVVMFANRLQGNHAVLCEGPVDALKAHLVGGNIASMGKAVSIKQTQLLLAAGIRKLYLALDPDAAAEIDPLLEKFEDVEVFRVVVPEGFKDLGAMTLEGARDAILASEPLPRGRMHLHFK